MNPTEQTTDAAADAPAQWLGIQAELRSAYGEDIFASWFERLELERVAGPTIEMTTPTQFVRHWVQTQYAADILKRWCAVRPGTADVRFKVRIMGRSKEMAAAATAGAAAPNRADRAASPAQRRDVDGPSQPLITAAGLEASPLEPRYALETFVEGQSNNLALAAGKKVAFARAGERCQYNPLYISGAVGLGKTHLLQAIAAAAIGTGHRRALYVTAEHYMYRFVSALQKRTTIAFKDVLRDIDILLIDDIQFLNGQRVLEEFGHTLTTLIDAGRQVVVAADRAPGELEGIDARIKSRLGGGLVVEIEAPDYPMRRAILEHRIAAQRTLFDTLVFPEEVVDFVARSVTTNGRDLDGAVNRLVAHNQLTGTPIDMKMAENALRDLLRARETKRPKIEDIQRVTSQHFNVSRQDLVSARRTRVIVRPRQIAMYLSKTLTPRSLPEIGRRFGNRDHTTVLHAVRKVEEMISKDPQTAEDIETLKRLLDQ